MWEAGREEEEEEEGVGEEVGLRVYEVREGEDVGMRVLLLFLDEEDRVATWFCQI
jgi:hypothetical protein